MPKNDAQYEAMFLFGNAGEGDHAINTCRQMVERHDGKIILIKKWDERKLTYEISKAKRGTYILAYFTAPGPAIAQIERDVSLSEEVLRVLVLDASHVTQKEMEAAEPQPIQVREERRDNYMDFGAPRGDRPPRDDRGPRDDRPPRDDRAPRKPREEEAGANKD